jgi:hypothetical protein
MSRFHQLSSGKTGQPAIVGEPVMADVVDDGAGAPVVAVAVGRVRDRRVDRVRASEATSAWALTTAPIVIVAAIRVPCLTPVQHDGMNRHAPRDFVATDQAVGG